MPMFQGPNGTPAGGRVKGRVRAVHRRGVTTAARQDSRVEPPVDMSCGRRILGVPLESRCDGRRSARWPAIQATSSQGAPWRRASHLKRQAALRVIVRRLCARDVQLRHVAGAQTPSQAGGVGWPGRVNMTVRMHKVSRPCVSRVSLMGRDPPEQYQNIQSYS